MQQNNLSSTILPESSRIHNSISQTIYIHRGQSCASSWLTCACVFPDHHHVWQLNPHHVRLLNSRHHYPTMDSFSITERMLDILHMHGHFYRWTHRLLRFLYTWEPPRPLTLFPKHRRCICCSRET